VEGVIAVAEALESGADVVEIFATPGLDDALAELAASRDVPVIRVTESVLASIADTTTPQGVVATARIHALTLNDISDCDLVLVLADVRDPGNAGTLLRSAAAAGAGAVIACKGSVDLLHPKTVRASAGSIFAVPIVRDATVEEAAAQLKAHGLTVLGADQTGPDAFECDLSGRLALVVGNEAGGLTAEVRALVDACVGIPMPGRTESLNVGIAGSILLFEAVRQRRAQKSSARSNIA
jgi:RNA methyltransferase, TrmH family